MENSRSKKVNIYQLHTYTVGLLGIVHFMQNLRDFVYLFFNYLIHCICDDAQLALFRIQFDNAKNEYMN